MIVELARAKLNLALHVRARRPDGYHELETLFAFVEAGDELRIAPADALSLEVTGPFAAALAGEGDNLVLRAARRFAETFGGGPWAITLDKRLPVASGIGGGSADAAATLRALARLADIPRTNPRLRSIAEMLGSDVPACLAGRAAIGRGRGERLRRADVPSGAPVLLVNPGVPVSTAEVFAAWDQVDRGPLRDWQNGRNDLTVAACAIAPAIAAALALLDAPGVKFARMSGSGATCFALCATDAARDTLAIQIARSHPGWWICPTRLV